MRLLVFGTSNSILKNGYLGALRSHPDVTRLDRIGYGGSTSIMLPYLGARVIFGEYDYVLVDCSVNDGAFLGWGLLQPEEIRDNLRWLCKTALQAGCAPIFLCMPNRPHLVTQDPALGVYREIAAETGAVLIDGYEFARAIAAADGVPAGDLFTDDLHLRPEIAERLAPKIVAACQVMVRKAPLPRAPRFRVIEAKALDLPQSKRATSLVKADCAELHFGRKLALKLEEGEQICGVIYNAGRSFGSLIFNGRSKSAVNIRSPYFQKQELVASARQVSPAVSAKDGVVTIFVRNAEEATAELLGFVIRCDAGHLQDERGTQEVAPAPPPGLTFPPEEAAAVTELYSKARVILEYGSGGSTVLAARQAGTTIFSVESDADWAMRLQDALDGIHDGGTVHLHPVDVGPTGPWGRPTDQDRWRSFMHYPTSVWERPDLLSPDLVLIDGRFRVGCFLASLMNIKQPTTFLFDDYRDRDHYHVVEELLRPTRLIGRMAVFDAQPRQLSPRDLRRFSSYFFDPD